MREPFLERRQQNERAASLYDGKAQHAERKADVGKVAGIPQQGEKAEPSAQDEPQDADDGEVVAHELLCPIFDIDGGLHTNIVILTRLDTADGLFSTLLEDSAHTNFILV